MFRQPLRLILLVGLLASCSAPTPTPLPTATLAPTTTVAPTVAPSATQVAPTATQPSPTPTLAAPTPTAGPTATPFPPLAAHGPYLVAGIKQEDGFYATITGTLTLWNADGSGRGTVTLPPGGYIPSLQTALSPDGQWVAFYTGNTGNPGETTGPFNLTLHLLHLPDGLTRTVTPLLSPDFPANFEKVAEHLQQTIYVSDTLPGLSEGSWWAFNVGIWTLAWSPDSTRLAFAGEMEGPSSDLYVYNLRSEKITRLSDGWEQLQEIDWSPDGRWIMHGSIDFVGEGTSSNFYVATTDGGSVKNLNYGGTSFGWLNSTQFVVYDADIEDFNLELIDVRSGVRKTIWAETVGDFAYDPANRTWLISSVGGFDLDGGVYRLRNDKRERLHPLGDYIAFWDTPTMRFVFTDSSTKMSYGVNAAGEITPIQTLDDPRLQSLTSPDHRWLILGTDVYGPDGQLTRQIADWPQGDWLWRPDGQSLFIITPQAIFLVAWPDGDPQRIDAAPPGKVQFAWAGQ